ncbi:putative ribonuclease H-like domain-containing protein [Tanacetum coccineum]
MSSRSRFGLGFGDTFGSDEVFDLSAPSIFDSSPKDVAEKPLHDRFVKTVGMHAVPPPLTGTFMPPSNNPDLDETQFTYGSKSNNNFETNSQHLYLASSRNRQTFVPAGSRNRPTFVPASSRNRQTSVPAGSRNGTTSVPADSGCSRSMTGNKEKLDDFVKIVGGTVTFGGGDGKITGKGTIRTSKLNFENVYYVEELQNFNLFSVSQICDTKNKVLFTDKECLVLSKEFQLPENSQVVLRIPRRHNLYCFNLSDIQPERDVTCLLAKASLEESTKWHRRMAHVNFKNMNKLAKHGLVNGLPSKLFTNKHNCVACNKGKQYKASYKAVTAVSTISAPLQLLHMDLFGPTSIRSIDHKYYSLVVTDDFSRFTWVFFLGTKDETYGILKDFITFIENQLTKKTPYELVSGKVPNISHLKPFGCRVTILKTSDHLGKFEGKADEGFIVGYAAHSKAYRVYNLSSKKIEETLNLRYLEDKPNVQGLGHEWYFDLDYLTDSLGYTRFKTKQPAGTQDTNIHAGTQEDSDSECDEQVILVPSFPSNSFSGPKVHEASDMVESSSDYAEELARLQRQAFEANATAEKHLSQADLAASRNRVPAGKVDTTAGVSDGPTESSTPVFTPVHTDATSLPPGHSLGSSEHSSRYPSPSDLANSMSSSSEMEDIHHHSDTGIFSSSSYDDDFGGPVTNLAPSVVVDSVLTKRVNTIHPQSQILGDLTSPVQTRGTLKKSKFGASAFVSYVHDQQRNNHTDYLHCLFACFLSQLEPSSVTQALNDQLVAKIEAIRLFLAFASYMGFMAWCDDLWNSLDERANIGVIAWTCLRKLIGKCEDLQQHPYAIASNQLQDEPDDASYSDSDYAGSHGDRKLTTGGCQFLGRRLISWQCKKQTIVATSSTEAEVLLELYLFLLIKDEGLNMRGDGWCYGLACRTVPTKLLCRFLRFTFNLILITKSGNHMPLLATMLPPAQAAIAGESSGKDAPSHPQTVPATITIH